VTLGAHTRTVQAAYDALAPTFGRWNASIEGDVIHMTEPEGETAFLWLLGQRPA
jgi:hypothetical protein